MSLVSSKVKYIRESCGMSQKEFSQHIGFSQTAVTHWETGKKIPSLQAMIKIFEFAKEKRVKIKRGEFFTM